MPTWLFLRFVASLLSDLAGCQSSRCWSTVDVRKWFLRRCLDFIKANDFD